MSLIDLTRDSVASFQQRSVSASSMGTPAGSWSAVSALTSLPCQFIEEGYSEEATIGPTPVQVRTGRAIFDGDLTAIKAHMRFTVGSRLFQVTGVATTPNRCGIIHYTEISWREVLHG